MHTNINVDDELVPEAQGACGYASKRQTIEQALCLTIARAAGD
ncbi:MAG TPA: type II toxin-antitoxin system VapB family antitoxin [Xanthobacteraceae bacterium]